MTPLPASAPVATSPPLPPGEPAAAVGRVPYDPSWGDTFHQFSATHLVTVLCCAGVVWALCWIGRRQRRLNNLARDVADGPGQLLGVLAIAHWVVHQVWWNVPVRFGPDTLIPLQLCDVAGLVGGLALLTGNRALTTTIYFWAFALSTQAFVTPILTEGPAFTRFWLFFESHTIVVGSAVYIVAVRGYRPSRRDFLFGVAVTVGYAAVVLPINLLFGWNFGYIGRPREDLPPTVMDALGPWPLRLVPLAAIVIGAMAIVYLPWVLADRFGAKGADESPSGRG